MAREAFLATRYPDVPAASAVFKLGSVDADIIVAMRSHLLRPW